MNGSRIFNTVIALLGSGSLAFVHFTMTIGIGLNGVPEQHSETFNILFVLALLCLPVAVILAAMLKTRAYRGVLILQMLLIAGVFFYGTHLFPEAKQAKQVAYNQKRISWLLENASDVVSCPKGYQLVLTQATPTIQDAPPTRGLFLLHPSASAYPIQLQHSIRGTVMKGNVVPQDVPDPTSCGKPNDPMNYHVMLDELRRWNDDQH